MLANLEKGNPLILKGSPFERGLLQAKLCPEMIEPVRKNILSQLCEYKELLQLEKITSYLEQQTKITKELFPEVFGEIKGIAKGFALSIANLFGFYHLRIVRDMDGCTSWALSLPHQGAIVGKNRDLAANNQVFQRVFLHNDPDWKGRKILSVGSLGAPCAYSSGMNSSGFCLGDTNILTSDHGLGACRYFLMPFLLATCNSVDQALKKISELPHAGGGSLTLADGNEKITIVELGHHDLNVKKETDWLAITNHFTSTKLAPSNLRSGRQSEIENSEDRLRYITSKMPGIYQDFSLKKATEIMKNHSQPGGLCRHGKSDSSSTISGSLYTCRNRELYFSDGNPCDSLWYEFSFSFD
jgi:isopenicillin-N N-acyltransferase like protein